MPLSHSRDNTRLGKLTERDERNWGGGKNIETKTPPALFGSQRRWMECCLEEIIVAASQWPDAILDGGFASAPPQYDCRASAQTLRGKEA